MIRSFQSLIPFILATLGWFMSLVAGNLPLFEWQISDVGTDLPVAFEVHVAASPLITGLADSLDHGVNSFRTIWVNSSADICFVATRSQREQMLERLLNINPRVLEVLYIGGQVEVVLLLLYIWFFTIWHESFLGCLYSIFSTFFAGVIFVLIFEATRPFNTPHLSLSDFGPADCYGTVTFKAELLRVHFETPLVLFVAIGLELGALAIVFYQIRKSVSERNESSKLAVG